MSKPLQLWANVPTSPVILNATIYYLTLIVGVMALVGSLWSIRQKKYTLAILCLVVGGLALRMFASYDQFLHPWDERYHALVAKNMMGNMLYPVLYEHPILDYDYRVWTDNHIWLHKQPMAMWLISGTYQLFGTGDFVTRIPSILLTTVGIYCTYRIGYRLFGRRVGYYAAFLFSVNGLILENVSGRTATDHVDSLYLSFVTIAIFLAIESARNGKHWLNLLCGAFVGLAILTKWLPALIVLPLWLLEMKRQRSGTKQILLNGLLMVLVMSTVVLPWQMYIHVNFPLEAGWEQGMNFKHLTTTVEGREGGPFFHLEEMRISFGELVYLPLLWLIIIAIRKRKITYMFLLTWVLVPVVFFSLVETKMPSYLLFTSPAIFITIGLFARYIRRIFRRSKIRWLSIPVLVLLIALPVRYTIERLKMFDLSYEYEKGWASDLKKFGKTLDDPKKVVLFNTQYPVEAMYYTDCTAYLKTPNRETLDSLMIAGYEIHINNSSDTTQFRKGTIFHNFEE